MTNRGSIKAQDEDETDETHQNMGSLFHMLAVEIQMSPLGFHMFAGDITMPSFRPDFQVKSPTLLLKSIAWQDMLTGRDER